jgi:cullin-associated NEDD8-dissociated protein 1
MFSFYKVNLIKSCLSIFLILTIIDFSRQAGHRIGENLESIIPLIVYYSQCKDEELVEYSLQAFESFVRRCPKEMLKYVKQIIDLCLKFITYDPNYNYDDDNDMNDDDSMEFDANDDEK